MKRCETRLYYGYGDNIWQLPFINQLCKDYDEVYIETYFPFLFEHLSNVRFILPHHKTKLETCKECLDKYKVEYIDKAPDDCEFIKFPYYLQEFKNNKDMITSFSEVIKIDTKSLNTPMYIPESDIKRAKELIEKLKKPGKMVCLIRPPANRRDWNCSARIPKIEYYQYLINKYKDYFTFISIGNKPNDVYIGELKNIDYRFDYGQLDIPLINALVKLSDLVITYNCFLYPLGVKNFTKTICINGGFTDPLDYVSINTMKLDHLVVVNPEPLCKCHKLTHECEKDIPISKLDEAIEKLFKIFPKKKNLLLSRIRDSRCTKLMNNPWIKANYNIYTVDHVGLFNYKNKGFIKSFQFPSVGNICIPKIDHKLKEIIYNFCKMILKDSNIHQVINAQPLHPYNEIMNNVCKKMNIDSLNYETFFDDKWILDRKGSQYTDENEIYDYIGEGQYSSQKINYPNNSREKQPDFLTMPQIYSKYKLKFNKKYIVVFGQLLWDMSLKKSICKDINNVIEFYSKCFNKNPDITFLFKIHPKINSKHSDMKFLEKFDNVILINEGLETLFNSFDKFISFSSHCIFEGLLKEKKFASSGHHYVNHPDLVYQIKDNNDFKNIYNKLDNFSIDKHILNIYKYFICNCYSCYNTNKQIFNRLTKSSKQYFLENK